MKSERKGRALPQEPTLDPTAQVRPKRWYTMPDDIGLYPYQPVSNYEYGPSDYDPNVYWQIRMLTPEEVQQRESEKDGLADPVPTALYRLRNKGGDLLYVGISEDPYRRWTEHAGDKPWWPQVVRLELDWHASRDEAAAAETEAIGTERPTFNAVGQTSPMLTSDPWRSAGPVTSYHEEGTPSAVKVCDVLERALVSGALEPGDLLPTRRQICEKFRVTGATAIEALDRLYRSGLIEFSPARVARFCGPPDSA